MAATVRRARSPGRPTVTAPQDPFGTPPQDGPGTPSSGTPGVPAPDQQYGQQQYGQQQAYGQPAYGQPAYGQPAYGQAPAGQARNGLGVASLVLGILAALTGFFLIGGLFGVVAVVLGFLGRGRAKRGEATNGGLALAGIILGVIGVLLTAAVIAIGASFLSEFGNLTECLNSAGQDQAKIDQCGRDFEQDVTTG